MNLCQMIAAQHLFGALGMAANGNATTDRMVSE
jgi:hypothetical protein